MSVTNFTSYPKRSKTRLGRMLFNAMEITTLNDVLHIEIEKIFKFYKKNLKIVSIWHNTINLLSKYIKANTFYEI